MHPVFLYFSVIWSLVALGVGIFHLRTAGSMNLSTLSPLPLPAGTTRIRARAR